MGDIAPGSLLGPGSAFELDTSSLAPGIYDYVCKIHPGMRGTITVTSGAVTSPIVTVVAGFADSVFAQQAFAPANVTVARGTIVRWTLLNPTEPHTITHSPSTGAPAWDSSPNFPPAGPPGPPPFMVPGDSFSLTFNTAGTFTYFCKLHAYKVGESWAGMVGTVLVVPLLSAEAINTLTVVSYIGVALAAVALVISLIAIVRRKS